MWPTGAFGVVLAVSAALLTGAGMDDGTAANEPKGETVFAALIAGARDAAADDLGGETVLAALLTGGGIDDDTAAKEPPKTFDP